MEITIEKLDSAKDLKYCYEAFTVFIDEKRILTLYTEDHSTIKKWISELLKSQKTRSTPLIVGLSVDRENRYPFGKESENANPFSILQLCVGSHCLIYELPFSWTGYRSKETCDLSLEVPKSLQDFLSDPQTICVGVNIEEVAKKLGSVYGLKVENRVEVRSLVERGLKQGVSGFDLDKLVKIDLGKKMDVMRPKDVGWCERRPGSNHWWDDGFSREKAKFATVDAYLCYVIGSKYLITSKKKKIKGGGGGGCSSKK